jgi:hypothetical protein
MRNKMGFFDKFFRKKLKSKLDLLIEKTNEILKRTKGYKPKKPLEHYDNYLVTIETPSDEDLEFIFQWEKDRIFKMAKFYKTHDLRDVATDKLIKEKQILEEEYSRLEKAAMDYAFSGHENLHPDYKKAIACWKITSDGIEKALAYQERGFE